jgi:hypothetical protein
MICGKCGQEKTKSAFDAKQLKTPSPICKDCYKLSAAYARHKDDNNRRKRQATNSIQEIGPLPKVVNPDRREQGRKSLEFFLVTYFPQSFRLQFSDDHRRIIASLETAATQGGLKALAMPRGSGKTTICIRAAIWGLVYGLRKFVALVGSSGDAAKDLLNELKVELETNKFLAEDFPEICHPIQKLEGISQRAKGQKLDGRATNLGWKGAQVILPTVTGSLSSGSILKVSGILGRVRGMKYVTSDGESLRPDLVIVDDPQTDASAKSENQCAQRERVLSGAILGLAGPGQRIAAMMPCTVIRKGDMADRILDKSIHPLWNGERCRLVYAWPTNQKLWDQYAEYRLADLRQGNDTLPTATAFYRENQISMDEGSKVGWAARYEPHEVSALQHAFNLRLAKPDTFDAEYQNDPRESLSGQALRHVATSDAICQRVSGYARRAIPRECSHLVASVDVQQSVFFWLVLAVDDRFSSWVVDYGAWPEQPSQYWTLQDLQKTTQDVTGVQSLEASLLSGLRRLETTLLGQSFTRDDGASMPIERLVIDANWGPSTKTVYSFCRQSDNRSVVWPYHGKGIGARSNPMDQWVRKPGEMVGPGWRVPPINSGSQVPRHILADVNTWKTTVHQRLQQPDGEPGAIMLFKASPMAHRMFADHCSSEFPTETAGQGRTLLEWQLRPGRDNHWLDCLVMAQVAASMLGVRSSVEKTVARPVARKSLAQLREEAAQRKFGKHAG